MLDGKTIWEQYPGGFDGRNICNTGSCVSNANITDAAIKVATIFAHRNHRGNFDDIADYILNKVGACGVAWGPYSQKAASIATGCNRLRNTGGSSASLRHVPPLVHGQG